MDASVNRIKSSSDEIALIIGIHTRNTILEDVEHSLDELELLVKTAGALVHKKIIFKRPALDAGYLTGKGSLENIKDLITKEHITLVVFDLNHIRPAQIRNIEEKLKCRVLGRTEIILDIFARRAKSAESKIQVELAQLRYILPRLKGLGGILSRLGGGIGTRGPGEKMLETDRRHILRRIEKLNQRLRKINSHRSLIRKNRSGKLKGAVVGYTNAGKSTLINYLAKDDLFVENRLFATLEAYTRNVYLDNRRKALLTDTVGFIANLPANLVQSFKSTLEEISFSDFIIHVIDINSRNMDQAIKTVEKELVSLECTQKPVIRFFNKSDIAEDDIINAVRIRYPESIIGSALNTTGLNDLKNQISIIYDQHFALMV